MKDNIITIIKVKIDRAMRAQGYKRYSLADKAGVSYPTIQNWYTKRDYDPSISSLTKISSALGMTLSQLCMGENESLYPVDEKLRIMLDSYLMLPEHHKDLIFDLINSLRKE